MTFLSKLCIVLARSLAVWTGYVSFGIGGSRKKITSTHFSPALTFFFRFGCYFLIWIFGSCNHRLGVYDLFYHAHVTPFAFGALRAFI